MSKEPRPEPKPQMKEEVKHQIAYLEPLQRLEVVEWLVDDVMSKEEAQVFSEVLENVREGHDPLEGFDVDTKGMSLQKFLYDTSVREGTEAETIPIQEAVENGFAAEMRTTDPTTGEDIVRVTLVELEDGVLRNLDDLKNGEAQRCPNCKKWVSRCLILKCATRGILICHLCAKWTREEDGDLVPHSKWGYTLKTVKDFFGRQNEPFRSDFFAPRPRAVCSPSRETRTSRPGE